jgi:glycosyltransferase involved in cell wall biosynthesis
MIRVGFTPIGGATWTGGRVYLTNLLRALQRGPQEIQGVVFVGEDAEDAHVEVFSRLPGVEIVRSTGFNQRNSRWRTTATLLGGLNKEAAKAFSDHQIDVVFEAAQFFGYAIGLPTIAWLPDFQHRRLRDNFPLAAYWRRELGFRAQVASGRTIMLSSEDARIDCEHFYPGSRGRTAVVRFAALIDPGEIESDPTTRVSEYDLPRQFLYLPNQFWKHKNHAVVVEALGLLKERGQDVVVAASGNPVDGRGHDQFAVLKRRIRELGIESNFRMLGMIPRAHLISLLRTCTGLINPSFFEGWSTTVEEARAFDVPMILSAIDSHREQMGKRATYFSPYDPKDVAERMSAHFAGFAAPSLPRMISPGNATRVKAFAEDFLDVLSEARNRYRAL